MAEQAVFSFAAGLVASIFFRVSKATDASVGSTSMLFCQVVHVRYLMVNMIKSINQRLIGEGISDGNDSDDDLRKNTGSTRHHVGPLRLPLRGRNMDD